MVMTSAPASEHPWVLVEGHGTETRSVATQLRVLGYEVNVCPGPSTVHPCPVQQGSGCRLIEAAEIVVNALGDRDDGSIAAATRAAADVVLLHLGPSGGDDAHRPGEPSSVGRRLAQRLRGARVDSGA